MVAGAQCFQNVNQTTPINNFASQNYGSAGSFTLTFTANANDTVASFFVVNGNEPVVATNPQSQVWLVQEAPNSGNGVEADNVLGTGSNMTLKWTVGTNHSADLLVVEINNGGCPPTLTNTFTPNPTPPTNTPTNTSTSTPTVTATPTNTPLGWAPPTNTFTPTATNTFTFTPTFTNTNTFTVTPPTPPPTPQPGQCTLPNGASNTNMPPVDWEEVFCYSPANTHNTLIDANQVFGMSLNEIKEIADFIGDSTTPVTLNIGSYWKLSYFTGNLTYDATYPAPYNRLNSYGILVVDGNLTLNAPSNYNTTLPSYYGGVVFVTGNLFIGAGCEIDGSIIMGTNGGNYYQGGSPGTLTLDGNSTNGGYVFYSPGMVTTAMSQVASYREDISQRKVILAIPNM